MRVGGRGVRRTEFNLLQWLSGMKINADKLYVVEMEAQFALVATEDETRLRVLGKYPTKEQANAAMATVRTIARFGYDISTAKE
jgi:hypothetical protein